MSEALMILRQFLHTSPGDAPTCSAAGGGRGRRGRSGRRHRALSHTAQETGMRIRYVIDTHLHADHISTDESWAKRRCGIRAVCRSERWPSPFHGVRDGDVLRARNVSVQVLAHAGHTPEHISLVVTDRTRADEPWFVLTGHTLMVGDLGQTELATSAEEGARALFRSVLQPQDPAGLSRNLARSLFRLGLWPQLKR